MKTITIADTTLRERDMDPASGLNFKEQLEIAKTLEKLHVDVIETGYLREEQVNTIAVRTMAGFLKNTVLSVPVPPEQAAVDAAWAVLTGAAHPRIDLVIPASAVQMEYVFHMKPKAMLERITELAAYCTSLCDDVELTVEDATRSDMDFLKSVLSAAVSNGVKTVTICDTAGEALPSEIEALVRELLPVVSPAALCMQYRDELGLATANALAGISAGAIGVKTTCGGSTNALSLETLIHALRVREDALGVRYEVNANALQRGSNQIERLMGMNRTGKAIFACASPQENSQETTALSVDSDYLTVRRRVESMGYDLEESDMEQLFHQFRRMAAKKPLNNRELEAMIAECTQQVSPAYQLVHYVMNSGNSISATACIKIKVTRTGEIRQAACIGDGPVDAAFLTLEEVLGRRFELDDFQIRAVTEGREAMGDALVKLRHDGKLYSGHGLSTDIMGASISAYLNAVNKIVCEEK